MTNPPIPIQRLRLSRSVLDDIIDSLDRSDTSAGAQSAAQRRPVHRPAVIIQAPDGEIGTRHEVYIRNVSTTGASVLHTAFLQPQHACILVLVTETREPVTIDASVVRCEHVSGQIHDVGVRFVRELTEDEARGICLTPGSVTSMATLPPTQLAEAISKCKRLANKVHDLVESGAPATEVLPLLDELRSMEPGGKKAA